MLISCTCRTEEEFRRGHCVAPKILNVPYMLNTPQGNQNQAELLSNWDVYIRSSWSVWYTRESEESKFFGSSIFSSQPNWWYPCGNNSFLPHHTHKNEKTDNMIHAGLSEWSQILKCHKWACCCSKSKVNNTHTLGLFIVV